MEHSTRLAHISEDGTRTQTVYDHLAGTARLAGSFAAPFGAQSEAEFAAWLHDVGKYSDAFQLRLKGGPKVDHSTAGAQEAWVRQHPHTAFAVAGHHSGLPDGGSPADDPGDATLFGRSKKPVAPYDGWQEVTLPASTPPAWACSDPLSLAFFTRMLYSCLVDADFIDTETFMDGKAAPRGSGADIAALRDIVSAQAQRYLWAENAAPAYSNAMLMFFCGGAEAHGVSESDLAAALKALSQGRPVSFLDDKLDPNQNFYVLGISPNAARLSVRFFLHSSFGQFAKNLQDHADRLSITRPAFDKQENLSVWALAQETVNQNKNPSPQLVGDLLRAILTGGPYPATLLNGVTLRIRAEREVTRGRAAILKAYYLRNYPTKLNKEVFTVSLNESSNVPYVLGRLFSVLETIQSVANRGINATIKDRYFNSACATPATAFPTLVKLAQKHLQKMSTPNEVHFSKQLTELMAQLPETGFPARLSLPEQGAFEIGYYHQTQKRYAKKNEEE